MVSDFSEGWSEVSVCPTGRSSQSPDTVGSPGQVPVHLSCPPPQPKTPDPIPSWTAEQ